MSTVRSKHDGRLATPSAPGLPSFTELHSRVDFNWVDSFLRPKTPVQKIEDSLLNIWNVATKDSDTQNNELDEIVTKIEAICEERQSSDTFTLEGLKQWISKIRYHDYVENSIFLELLSHDVLEKNEGVNLDETGRDLFDHLNGKKNRKTEGICDAVFEDMTKTVRGTLMFLQVALYDWSFLYELRYVSSQDLDKLLCNLLYLTEYNRSIARKIDPQIEFRLLKLNILDFDRKETLDVCTKAFEEIKIKQINETTNSIVRTNGNCDQSEALDVIVSLYIRELYNHHNFTKKYNILFGAYINLKEVCDELIAATHGGFGSLIDDDEYDSEYDFSDEEY